MKKRFFFTLSFLLLLGVVLYWFDPKQYALMPKCPFKMLTGWSCPGCGLQRGIHALLHGHFSEALSYNYFFILSIPYATGLCLERWFLPTSIATRWRRVLENRYTMYAYMIIFCIWWVGRNIWSL